MIDDCNDCLSCGREDEGKGGTQTDRERNRVARLDYVNTADRRHRRDQSSLHSKKTNESM